MAGASYWNCPICLRRVPERVAECYCGRTRQPGDGPDAPEEAGGGGRGPLLAVIVFAACAAAAYALLRQPEPENLPEPAASPAQELSARTHALAPELPPRSTPPPTWPETRPTPSVAPPSEVQPPLTAAPKPTPTPADSVDAQRERGAASFEAAMKNLSGRVVTLRGQVKHFNEQCPAGAVLVLGCDAPREQIEQALREIRTALDEAEEAARRSWVDPGVQRTIRDRSGMDDVTVGELFAAASAATRP